MAINKVVFGSDTLIDLSQDTVTSASHIMSGHRGHLADGTVVSGTGQGGGGGDQVLDDLFTGAITSYNNSTASGTLSLLTNLKSLTMSHITSIASYAFWRNSYIETVDFPECVTIGDYAFSSCSKLNNVSFPECVSIGSQAFANCVDFCKDSGILNLPKCTTIGSMAFANAAWLTSISFPACETVYMNAFSGCAKLQSLDLPVCTSIGNNAFLRCTSISTVSLPQCQSIGAGAFSSCTALTTAYIGLEYSSVCRLGASTAFPSTIVSIYVKASLYDEYYSSTNWTYFRYKLVSYTE